MTASDHRLAARNALKGNWLWAALTTLVASLLGGIATAGGSSSVKTEYTETIPMGDSEALGNIIAEYLPLIGGAAIIALAIGAIFLFLGSVVGLGYRKYTLSLIDGEPAEFKMLFSQFHRLWPAVRMHLLMDAVILLPLIVVIPMMFFAWGLGIILMIVYLVAMIYASFGFVMADFVMAEDEHCGAREALRRSWALMTGRRMDFFFLGLSFIGWDILCAFTFGIGNLFLTPYIQVAYASFYREMKPKAGTSTPNDGYTDYAGANSEFL